MVILALLLSCGSSDPVQPGGDGGASTIEDGGTATTPTAAAELVPLDTPRLLRRLSLDLRGVLPSVDELDAVEADPTQVDVLRDAWLEDPRLEERLVHLYAERWYTRVDRFLLQYTEYLSSEDETQEYAFERMVGEEPLRLVARVIASDRPWSEVVTADWTMANPLMGELWPVAHPGGEGWAEATYTDGRPAAGVLATNGLWWRYFSTVTNYNRGRTAALTRLLICEDYQARTISFAEASGSLADADEIEDALRESPYCMGCHSSLDPIAATLFGFWPANEYNADEVDTYHPEREAQGAVMLGVEPEWYGDPVDGLADLGAHIAADPRFDRCAVQTLAGLLWRRDVTDADFDRVEALRQVYLDEGGLMKPVLRAITDGETYRAGGVADTTDDVVAERENTLRLLSPDQLETAVEDLSGFTWTWEGYRQLDNDPLGYRVMAGGVDGELSTRALSTPNMTTALVVQRLAEAAADHAVAADLAGSGPGLLSGVSAADRPGDAAFDAALETLCWRLLAVRPDEALLADLSALWSTVQAAEGETAAWEAVVVALLRDPLFLGT